ncbi:FG-GAP-like repeat-containing protein [Moritella viscosa]|uniref:FG-GAP-like repeat-containing protein n=1 Tax=Moritella viscosa TaxID=80854 RepID=UPI000AF77F26|nr:LamG-like jellyroll fold domain-containing protein [Moritella viscosa]
MLKINKSIILVTILLFLSISVLYGIIDGSSSSSSSSSLPKNNSPCSAGLDCSNIDRGIIRVIKPTGLYLSEAIQLASARSECSAGCVVDLRPLLNKNIILNSSLETVTNLSHPIWVVGEPSQPAVIDGVGKYQIISINNDKNTGFISFFGVHFINGLAQGQKGTNAGGGGLGAGGAIFINKGKVVLEQTIFSQNTATGGDSVDPGGAGGDPYDNHCQSTSAKPGGSGGQFNNNASFKLLSGGEGGKAGSNCGSKHSCDPEDGQHGKTGSWGAGGGSGGGGGGDCKTSYDAGRDGGNGANGGFGAGGGAGGSGGGDDKQVGEYGLEVGHKGYGGYSVDEKNTGYGGEANNGVDGGNGGGAAKFGGGGAGLGGAIFVREDNNAQLTMRLSKFNDNTVNEGVSGSRHPAQAKGTALFVTRDQRDYDFSNDDTLSDYPLSEPVPTVGLSLVNLNNEPIDRVYEGERANLKINLSQPFATKTHLYFYLSDPDAYANPGNSDDPAAIGQQTKADFAWGTTFIYSVAVPAETAGDIYLNIPRRQVNDKLGAYTGIQTYLDKRLEGDESFTVNLLASDAYAIDVKNFSQKVTIEDVNFQVEILSDLSRTTICDLADGLASSGSPCDQVTSPVVRNKINLDDIKSLGYVTLQAKRPVNVQRESKEEDLPNGWDSNVSQYSTAVQGAFFNNTLAGGLPVHYSITETESGVQFLSNQINYNNNRYEKITDGKLDDLEGAQIFNAVIIPVTDINNENKESDLPAGAARIYFAALPDAIKEESQKYTLILQDFTDPSYDADQLDIILHNTPAGEYQFYQPKSEAKDVIFTLLDSDEFSPGIIISDNINGEQVNKTENPLLLAEDESAIFWVKLSSQPSADVHLKGDIGLTFSADNWFTYQKVNISSWGSVINVSADSSDPFYNNLTLAIYPETDAHKLKITEGKIPDATQRDVSIQVLPGLAEYTEGSKDQPEFIISLGQPLPYGINVLYSIDDSTPKSIFLAAYHSSFTVSYPLINDDLINGVRKINIKLTGITNLSGEPLQGISYSKGGDTASLIIQDDDISTILISQYQAEKPTVGDKVILSPEVAIIGFKDNGDLMIQHHDPLIKDIVIEKKGAGKLVSSVVARHGLLQEIAPNEQSDSPLIYFPKLPLEAEFTRNEASFTRNELVGNTVARYRGQLKVTKTGYYRFNLAGPATALAELWLNPVSADRQNKGLIASLNEVPTLGTKDDEAISYLLDTEHSYYIEALYQNALTQPVGEFSVSWQFSKESEGSFSELVAISKDNLIPDTLASGFMVETWQDIAVDSIAEFKASQSYLNKSPDNSKMLTRALDIPLNNEDKIGRRIRTVLTAPETGEYIFALASDGDAQLTLEGAELEPRILAYIDGNEKYGKYEVKAKAHPPSYTRVQFELSRFNNAITAEDPWTVEYTMGENKGTLPLGNNKKLSLLPDLTGVDMICNEYNFINSEIVNWYGSTDNPVLNNQLYIGNPPTVSKPEPCKDNPDQGLYPDYDGKSITFIFQENIKSVSADDYVKFIVDGHDLGDPADYPKEHDWWWDAAIETETQTEGQKNSQQSSRRVHLIKGQQYTLEVLQVNSLETQHLSVAWQKPSDTGLVLLSADSLSLPQVLLPIELLATTSNIKESELATTPDSVSVSLKLSGKSVFLLGQEYIVKSMTLKGATNLDGTLSASTFMQFNSGFSGSVSQDVVLTEAATPVNLILRDQVSGADEMNLTVGQQQRLGFRLKSQPLPNAKVTIILEQSGVGSDANNSAAIRLYCDGSPTEDCTQFTFTAENWDQPQFVNVIAKSAGTDQQGTYSPDLSYINLTAKQNNDLQATYTSDSIKIQIFPNSLNTHRIYFVKSNEEKISEISFSSSSVGNIIVTDNEDTEVKGWTWGFKNKQLVASKNGTELLRLLPYSTEEAGSVDAGINAGVDPITLTAQAVVTSALFKQETKWRGNLYITGIQLEAKGERTTASADVSVMLTNGLPKITILSNITDEDLAFKQPKTFSYHALSSSAEDNITANVGEILLTEFGALTVVDKKGYAAWSFEANPRPQADVITFNISNAANVTEKTISLVDINKQPRIITSYVALSDPSKPLATLSITDNSVTEDGGEIAITARLAEPATQATRVYFNINTPSSNEPSNIALKLKDKTNGYALEVTDENVSLKGEDSTGITLEMWLHPEISNNQQGLFVGEDNNEESNLLTIKNQVLTSFNGFSIELPDNVIKKQWFHIAYTSSALGEVWYVNGEKVATNNANVIATIPTHLRAIGRAKNKTEYFSGAIDEVRIWTQPRTDMQIRSSYAITLPTAGLNDDYSSLSGLWQFNQLSLANIANENTQSTLENSQGDELDLEDSAVKQDVWLVKQSAQEGADYEMLTGFVTRSSNLFNLETVSRGRLFTIADFNGDNLPDAVVMDDSGQFYLHLNLNKKINQSPQFQKEPLNLILKNTVSMTAGDLDQDGDVDLVIGTNDGRLYQLKNTGDLKKPQFLQAHSLYQKGTHPELKSMLSPTLVDLDNDGKLELVVISNEGKTVHFSIEKGLANAEEKGRHVLTRSHTSLLNLPKLKQMEQGYFIQFVDFDNDGDKDAVIDYIGNNPGQLPGGLKYFENYGNAEQPYYVAAPHSNIANYLRHLDTDIGGDNVTMQHAYDQIEFYQFFDWDGDGDDDLFQSNHQGVISLKETQGFSFVTIDEGNSEANIMIKLKDDQRAEPLEFIQLQIVEGNVNQADYHTKTGSDLVRIDIKDNDQVGLVVKREDDSVLTLNDPILRIDVSETETDAKLYKVHLASQPNNVVKVKIATTAPELGGLVSKLPEEGFKDTISFKFNPEGDNWKTDQFFWVKGVDDLVDDESTLFSYLFITKSEDINYDNLANALPATGIENNDHAAINVSFSSLPTAAIAPGSIHATEGEINAVEVRLNSKPTQAVTVSLVPEDNQLTFFPQRRIIKMVDVDAASRQVKTVIARNDKTCTDTQGLYGTLCWQSNGDYTYQQETAVEEGQANENFSYVIDNGYGRLSSDSLSIVLINTEGKQQNDPVILSKSGNLFFNANSLAGQPVDLIFTPENWDLTRTVAVAAVDDDIVEYNHTRQIELLLTDPQQMILGNYGQINWDSDGHYQYRLSRELSEGVYQEQQLYFTQIDNKQSHTLDIAIVSKINESGVDIAVYSCIDRDNYKSERDCFKRLDDAEEQTFTGTTDGRLSGMSRDLLDPVYQMTMTQPLLVNIEDNDKPIVRAGVDLNAGENTHPGYFTFSVLENVGYPGGLPVNYTLYGYNSADPHGATAESKPPKGSDVLADPGPDFQGYDTLMSGTLYIPKDKKRVSFPIFPIDDLTPEESLAARYEKVVVVINPPVSNKEHPESADQYRLDLAHPETHKAAVRILDNEDIGLKIVMPEGGLSVEEGQYNGFRVGLKSQPQTDVKLAFYYEDVRYKNQRDRTFMAIEPIEFSTNNWNQWKTVDIHLFNNLISNDDALAPRYSNIYFTLLDESNECQKDYADSSVCEPFYNTMKGALNLTSPIDAEDKDALVIEGAVSFSGATFAEGEYGQVSLTPIKGSKDYLGDFVYRISDGKFGSSDSQKAILTAISKSPIGKIYDVFDYQIALNKNDTLIQKLAVEISAVNQAILTSVPPSGEKIAFPDGDNGTLVFDLANNSYTYTLNTNSSEYTQSYWTFSDSFIYSLNNENVEGDVSDNFAFNIDLTKYTATSEGKILSAQVNGYSPGVCDSENNLTVCIDSNGAPYITGQIISAALDTGSELEDNILASVSQYGRTYALPKVTNMSLRDKDDNDLWVGKGLLTTNPLFTANPLNSVASLIAVDNEINLAGQYGELILGKDATYIYKLDETLIKAGLDNIDERTVTERFKYILNNHSDHLLALTVTYKQSGGASLAQVQADSELLSSVEGEKLQFSGKLLDKDSPIKLVRAGLVTSSVYLQEAALDPIEIAQGISEVLGFLQARLYDTSVPLLGRLGGGPTGLTSGDASHANIPSFSERIEDIVVSELLKQPHLTTTEIQRIFTKALQATFGYYHWPVQILKFDNEKLMLKVSFTAGLSAQTDEFVTDWGMPGMGHFTGAARGTFKFTSDLVFGIKFDRKKKDTGYQKSVRPSIFIVTDSAALDRLLGSPVSKPVELYSLQTWEGISIAPNGIVFITQQGNIPDMDSKPAEPKNMLAINADLKKRNVKVYWQWKRVNPRHSDPYQDKPIYDFSVIEGIVKTLLSEEDVIYGKDSHDAPFIEISLKQPESIGPNKNVPIIISHEVDPDHNLNKASTNQERQNIVAVLNYLSTLKDGLKFKNRSIKATDFNDKNNNRGSQALNFNFDINVFESIDSTLLGPRNSTFTADIIVSEIKPAVELKTDRTLVMLSTTHKDPSVILKTSCEKTADNRCKPEKLNIKAPWLNALKDSVKSVPSDMNVFKKKSVWSETLKLEDGDLKVIGTLKKKGNDYHIEWTWEFSSLSVENVAFNGKDKLKDIDNIQLKGADDIPWKTVQYTLSKYKMMFLKSENTDTPKVDTVSKLSLSLSSALDFSGDMQLFVASASISQAPMQPANVSDTAQTSPAKVFKTLVGNYDDRDKVIEFTEANRNENLEAYIVGQYGILSLTEQGYYNYYLKRDVSESSYILNCLDWETNPPATAQESTDKILCKDLLNSEFISMTEEEEEEDQYKYKIKALFKGYKVYCTDEDKVSEGQDCKVHSPNILMTKTTKGDLKLKGVVSLENAIDIMGEGIPNWETSSNLSNKSTLNEFYKRIIARPAEDTTYGITQLQDDFFISTKSNLSFRKLSLMIRYQNELKVSFDNLSEITYSGDFHDNSWTGDNLSTFESNIKDIVKASKGLIQPMAKANLFAELALNSRNGILYLTELRKEKQGVVKFTLGGDAALYAQIDTAIGNNGGDAVGGNVDFPLPSVVANLGLTARYSGTDLFSNVSSRGGEFIFGIYNLGLDLGSLLSDQLVEPLSHVATEMAPIRPIANALTADMKLFSKLSLQHVFDSNNDGKVTVLEIPTPFLKSQGSAKAKKYANMLKNANRFLEFTADIFQLIEIAADLGEELSGAKSLEERIISSDGFLVSPQDIRVTPHRDTSSLPGIDTSLVPYVNQQGHIILGSDKNFEFTKTATGKVGPSKVKQSSPERPEPPRANIKPNKNKSKVKGRFNELRSRGIISFPILSSPLDILKFIFGDPAELILIDVPDVDLSFEIDQKFRPTPIPIFVGYIGGSMQIATDIKVGVDTGGLLQSICGSNTPERIWDCQGELSDGDRSLRLLNSIYIKDWSEQSYYAGGDDSTDQDWWGGYERELSDKNVWDKYELAGDAKVYLGAGLDLIVFGSFFQGGPGLAGGVDLVDICEATTPNACEPLKNGKFTAGGQYDGKLRAYDLAMQLITDPKDAFELGFTLYVELKAYVEALKIRMWEETLGIFRLYDFTLEGVKWAGNSAVMEQASIVGGTVFFDANGNDLWDTNEPIGFTDSKGRSTFNIPYQYFDKNADGLIDERDGLIKLINGVDTRTSKAQLVMLTTVPQSSVITPLTTLMTQHMAKGLSLDEAHERVINEFSLPEDLNLMDYNTAGNGMRSSHLLTNQVIAAQQNALNVLQQRMH